MAEAVLFSLAVKVGTTIASPAFKKAYEKACSIWGARKELEAITTSIDTINKILLDAEKQQEGSAAVKALVERIREVLYEADDLFDEVGTNHLLKEQMEGAWKPLKEVQVFFSKQNQVVSNYSIVKKIEAIRKNLDQINVDMRPYKFVEHYEKTITGTSTRSGKETGSFVNPKEVIGRDDDKKAILEFLYDKSYAEKDISLIAIVGIGGMGKSSLAQLVYSDENVSSDFKENRKGWACISNIDDEKEVNEKIYQSIVKKESFVQGLNLDQLQSEIRKFVGKKEKFLLVLDDMWDEDSGRGKKLFSLLSKDNAKGSKIIITARSSSVARAMNVDKTLVLQGLSEDASWDLFKRIAFSGEQENSSQWNALGRKIMKKCANVPLAIISIASLLKTKDTIDEWESFENEELSKIKPSEGSESIMHVLKLSYDYLPSNLKDCFAYCSLFQKDSILNKKNLINLWIAQGYVIPTENGTLEAAGHAHFMELFRRYFFIDVDIDNGYIESCKMHDLFHDLAQLVAGMGTVLLMGRPTRSQNKIRHVSVGCKIDESWNIPSPYLQPDRICSFLFLPRNDQGTLALDKKVAKFRLLRALDLQGLNITDVPSSIGKLKYLRYLNLSKNKRLLALPNSITKLVNLVTLDISYCLILQAFPNDFRKLISLRHLDITKCDSLVRMPSKFGELTSLHYLSDFKLSEGGGDDGKDNSGLDALVGLKLQGTLTVSYDKMGGWSDNKMKLKLGQIPETIDGLCIQDTQMRKYRFGGWKFPLPYCSNSKV